MKEFNQIGSRKVKENLEMSEKSRKEAKRKDIMKTIFDKSGARASSLYTSDIQIVSGMDEFDNLLNEIADSESNFEREELIKKAEDMIQNSKKSYDRVLSDSSLSTEDRDEIKKNRNEFIDEMKNKLEDVISKLETEKEVSNEKEEPNISSEIESNNNEEEKTMDLEKNEKQDLKNMSYVDYLCGVVDANSASVRSVVDFLVNGNSDINFYTSVEFGGAQRGQVEEKKQKRIEEGKARAESQLIDTRNKLAASNSEVDRLNRKIKMLEEQVSHLVGNIDALREEKNSLEQTGLEQTGTISTLNKLNSDLRKEVSVVRDDSSKKQMIISELEEQVRNLKRTIDDVNAENRNLEEKYDRDIKERDIEISELTGRLKGYESLTKNISAKLNEVSADEETENTFDFSTNQDTEQDNVSNEEFDLNQLKKGFENLNQVMNADGSFENKMEQGGFVR